MDNERIIQLAQKFVDGDITAFELEEFNTWYYSDEGEQYQVKSFDSKEDLAVEMYKKVMDRSGLHAEKPMRYRLWPRIAVAAAVAVVIFGAGLFYFSKDMKQVPADQVALVNDVAPGVSGATLTLANGKKIRLSDAVKGELAQQAGVSVSKSADGQLVYEVKPGTGASEDLGAINTLSTDKGETYQVKLPDGTVVWLNAASSLKYAANLLEYGKRKVTLQGEAFFKVAKDKKHPFVVESAGQQVEVLGTEFNVNAYADEPVVSTTLLEGSVNVFYLKNNSSKILKPGQQSTLKGGDIKVGDADVDQALSWKNGDFVFVGEDLKTVMRQVARWYDVEIEYQGNINSSGVVSTISRTKKLSQLLKALQINQGIHFKIEGRRVLVMP